jgi:uncharacterized protein YqeY
MSELLARVQADLNTARKSQDKFRTLLLSTTLSEIKNRRIELLRDLSDDEVSDVLRKSIKKRRESVDMYQKAGRAELADKESAEISALEQYLPAPMSEAEVRSIIAEAVRDGAATIGALMGAVMPRLKGKAEGGVISAIAREELARRG